MPIDNEARLGGIATLMIPMPHAKIATTVRCVVVMIETLHPVDARVKIEYYGPMTTTQDRNYAVITKTGGGWKKGDIVCADHGTGYSPGCMTCRNLPPRTEGR